MKRALVICIFLGAMTALEAVQPFVLLGKINKSIDQLTAEITKELIQHDFEILGMYHPDKNPGLCVIVFSCDEQTSLATSAKDKGAFGAVLKIGLIQQNGFTKVTLLNPHYIKDAYLINDANQYEINNITKVVEDMAKDALQSFIVDSVCYGDSIDEESLQSYHFLPAMARFNDVVELNEFDNFELATKIVKGNILSGGENVELVYELCFKDKEVAVLGVALNDDAIESKLLDLWGNEGIASMPLEICIQGNKAYILNGHFRIPVFKTDISRFKLFKIMGLSAEIKSSMKEIARNDN